MTGFELPIPDEFLGVIALGIHVRDLLLGIVTHGALTVISI
jgi:hypothetical protein